jgi:ketosteroid isomerase-like protein
MDTMDFAREWAAAWNSRDLPRILSHYAEDVVFRSPRAALLAGDGTVLGKAALAAYWRLALDRAPELHFVVEHVYAGHETVVIAYRNHRGQNAAEVLRFGPDGLVVEASANYA